jgi:hypothetical protein
LRNKPKLSLSVKDIDTRGATLEAAGVEFIDENGGGPGVRLREPAKGEAARDRRQSSERE